MNLTKRLNDLVKKLLPHAQSTAASSSEALEQALMQAQQAHVIDADALGMLRGVLQVSERHARDAMLPKGQMAFIEDEAALDDILQLFTENPYSRFPVLSQEGKGIGVILAKELLTYKFKPEPKPAFTLSDFLHPGLVIPESKRLDKLLKEFKQNHTHMALVIDEYGMVSGLITLEDVIEEIVGEIEDEDFVEDQFEGIETLSENCYAIQGATPLEQFNKALEAELSHEDLDTVGGLVAQQFGRFPKAGESISCQGWHFKVIKASRKQIIQLEASLVGTQNSTDT